MFVFVYFIEHGTNVVLGKICFKEHSEIYAFAVEIRFSAIAPNLIFLKFRQKQYRTNGSYLKNYMVKSLINYVDFFVVSGDL